MTVDSSRLAPDQPRSRAPGRAWFGTALGLVGAVLMFLGWYGISGTASVGEQMPYLASGSIPGAALVIGAAIVLGRESSQRAAQRTDALIAELHALLVEEIPAAPSAATIESSHEPDAVVALASSQTYHRPGCTLVLGKPGVAEVDANTIEQRHMAPCPVCEPDRPAA